MFARRWWFATPHTLPRYLHTAYLRLYTAVPLHSHAHTLRCSFTLLHFVPLHTRLPLCVYRFTTLRYITPLATFAPPRLPFTHTCLTPRCYTLRTLLHTTHTRVVVTLFCLTLRCRFAVTHLHTLPTRTHTRGSPASRFVLPATTQRTFACDALLHYNCLCSHALPSATSRTAVMVLRTGGSFGWFWFCLHICARMVSRFLPGFLPRSYSHALPVHLHSPTRSLDRFAVHPFCYCSCGSRGLV